MEVLVPFAAERPKTRLAEVLGPEDRRAFADAMLTDVLAAIRGADLSPTLLTTEPLDRSADQLVDDRPLTTAVNDVLADREPSHEDPLGVVMADLALATPETVRRLVSEGETAADLVIAPGLGGGTNALVVRTPEFRVDYHGASVRDHRRIAADIGVSVREVDSRRLATDVDDPADLAEVLLHGDGAARDWLRENGFQLDTGNGRVGVRRED
ncbi:MAG: 2-phospho-L-lactate guanylyltransferase [Halobaculum sp.]